MAIPIFSMNIFQLTKEICAQINGVLVQFWWSSGEAKGLHWYAWDRVSIPKREGGFGFKDLKIFNQALLSKQVWRILQHPNCLMARILKARYFQEDDILTAKLRKKASYAWKSILHGRDLLTKSMRYIVGDGSLVNMWTDAWIPDHPPRPPRALGEIKLEEKVNIYLDATTCQWNEQKLRDDIVEKDVHKILAVNISPMAHQDLLGWHYKEDGIYTVKSGYWLGTHLPISPLIRTYGSVALKQKLWNTTIPAKFHHFLWRLLTKSLATGSNLKRRHVTINDHCMRCCSAIETEDHIFFECPYAKQIWRAFGVSNPIINNLPSMIEDKIGACLQPSLSSRLSHMQDLPIWVLWKIWKSRNILIFQHKEIHWRRILRYAKEDAKEWKQVDKNMVNAQCVRRQRGQRSTQQYWQRPDAGWIRCNTDGSFNSQRHQYTAGWTIRDGNRVYRGSVQARGKKSYDLLECELHAILMALHHCWSLGYRNLIIECCQKAIDIITDKRLHSAYYNWKRDILAWGVRVQNIKFQWISRNANKVADRLAKGLDDGDDFIFNFYVPQFLNTLLHVDYIHPS